MKIIFEDNTRVDMNKFGFSALDNKTNRLSSLSSSSLNICSADKPDQSGVELSADKDFNGMIKTFNSNYKQTTILGTAAPGTLSGTLMISNMEGQFIAGFGADPKDGKDGPARLAARYGEAGWSASGKK